MIGGGHGADTLFGGAGADRFVYDELLDSTGAARDRILDFTSGTDKIEFSAIDANAGAAGDQAFTQVSRFSGAAGQAVFAFDAASGSTTISLDGDGDGIADFVMSVNGQINPSVDVIL